MGGSGRKYPPSPAVLWVVDIHEKKPDRKKKLKQKKQIILYKM